MHTLLPCRTIQVYVNSTPPVLALRCQSGDRETAVASQGTVSQRTRDP